MALFFKRKPEGVSALSQFVRGASSEQKKQVYTRVLEKATERQRAVMERAADRAQRRASK
jgi:hypothetical protein